MACTFADAARATAVADQPNRFTAVFNDDWLQGRGVYGGVVSAIIVNAVQQTVDRRRRLRSLTVCFTAPARPGEATVTTRLVREGAWVSTVAAELCGADGGVIATALATLAADRVVDDSIAGAATFARATMPDATPAAELEVLPDDIPGMPRMGSRFTWRYGWGDAPGTSGMPRMGVWLRLRDGLPGNVVDEAAAAAFLDVLPPALLSALPMMRPAASVEWTVQFVGPLPHLLGPDEELLVTAATRTAGGGYAEEVDELWTADGRLLAQARQTIALL
jgi:acyl-CoA thioesterase